MVTYADVIANRNYYCSCIPYLLTEVNAFFLGQSLLFCVFPFLLRLFAKTCGVLQGLQRELRTLLEPFSDRFPSRGAILCLWLAVVTSGISLHMLEIGNGAACNWIGYMQFGL